MRKGYLLSSGISAALLSSLCCITPVFSLLAGISGMAATFSWMDPFRPYLIVLTIGIVGFAWFQKLKPRTKEEIECTCEPARQSGGEDEKPSFWQSKRFLGLVTVFVGLMLAFPSYSHLFYSNANPSSSLVLAQDTTKMHKIVLDVKGMTCTGCENHIEHEVGLLEGVIMVDATYSTGSATIKYRPAEIDQESIIEAINGTGYTIIEKSKDQ